MSAFLLLNILYLPLCIKHPGKDLFSINWEAMTHQTAIGHLGFNSSLVIMRVCVSVCILLLL